MCLQELSGLVERILLLPVVLLLFLNNFVEVLSSTFLLLAFGPLLFYLSELLELIFEISLCLVTLLVLVTHVLIVRFQRLSVLLVRIIVVGQERLLGRLVSALKRSVISSLIIDGSLELSHGLLMAFLASLFDHLSLAHERGLVRVLILSECLASFLEVLYFDTCLLLSLFALFDILLEVVLLDLKLLSEFFHALARRLNLLLHADVILHGGSQLGEPELLHVFELLFEVGYLIVAGLVGEVAELAMKFVLHVFAAEVVYELQDVRLDGSCITLSSASVMTALEHFTIKRLHVNCVNNVHSLKIFLALGLRVQQTTDLLSKGTGYE